MRYATRLIAIAITMMMVSVAIAQKIINSKLEAIEPTISSAGNFNAVTAPSGCRDATFVQAAGSPVAVLKEPQSAAIGDFNLDGNPDLAVANYKARSVTILLGNGRGGFAEPPGSPVNAGDAPFSLVSGDFNLDGKPDLAVTNLFGRRVIILLGNGRGGFSPSPGSPAGVGHYPVSIAVGDFNLDGKPDLVTANEQGDTEAVTTLLGDGAGRFAKGPQMDISPSAFPSCVAIGDFNLDGRPDLALTNRGPSNVTILLSDKTWGGFIEAPGSPYSAGNRPGYVTIGDFNLDGKPDLAVANTNSSDVTILLGNGNGRFTQPPGSPVSAWGGSPSCLAPGDFNLDGKPDLAVVDRDLDMAFILLGNGSGGFAISVDSAVSVGSAPVHVGAGDFNHDGKPDLAVVNNGSNNVTILLNNCAAFPCGGVSFSPPSGSPASTEDGPASVAVGDFNLDGKPDMAVANRASNNVTILTGKGDGDFAPIAGSPIRVGKSPVSVAVGDFNLDGKPDLAVANQVSKDVSILSGNGAGGFSQSVFSPYPAGSSPAFVTVGDLNLNGKPDLVVANGDTLHVTIMKGDGFGTFDAFVPSPPSGGAFPISVLVGDFNLDGKPDIAAANHATDNVGILLGVGTEAFELTSGSPKAGEGPEAMAAGDFNLDGKPDLAVVNQDSNNVTILLGDGSGGFTRPVSSPVAVGVRPRSVAVADFNLDGKSDLAVVNEASNNVTILFGNGSGDFRPAAGSPIAVGTSPVFITVGDFNLDGKPDFAVVNSGSKTVTVRLNTCAAPPVMTCSRDSTVNADPGQCSASVSFTAVARGTPTPTVECKAGATVITSPHTFPVGVTPVTCAASNGTPPGTTCNFTVTVRDTQPPVLTCPADIVEVADPTLCPSSPCQEVRFSLPVASDNCPGATVVCSPPSRSCFPVGVTPVTCIATDASGNTAACRFMVTVFDVCLQDDSNPDTVLLFNSITGDYRFCCDKVTYTGRGPVIRDGCIYRLKADAVDRSVLGAVDKTAFTGTASLQFPPGALKCSITDTDTRRNSCSCR